MTMDTARKAEEQREGHPSEHEQQADDAAWQRPLLPVSGVKRGDAGTARAPAGTRSELICIGEVSADGGGILSTHQKPVIWSAP